MPIYIYICIYIYVHIYITRDKSCTQINTCTIQMHNLLQRLPKAYYVCVFIHLYIYIYGHFFFKVPIFPKFENSPGILLLNTVTHILVLWKILIQYKILDGKHTLFSVFCPQSSTFKKMKKYMFFMIFMNHFLTSKSCCNKMKYFLYLTHIHSQILSIFYYYIDGPCS